MSTSWLQKFSAFKLAVRKRVRKRIPHFSVLYIYLFLSFLIISPNFYATTPSLIDDGNDFLTVERNFFDLTRSELVDNPRTWPFRMIFRKVLYSLAGLNIAWHFALQAVVLAGICFLATLVLKSWRVKKELANSVGLFILILPSVFANFYRLGTAEHLQILLLLLSLFLLIKGNRLFLLIFIANLFVKETSIFFLLIPLCYGLNKRDLSLVFSLVLAGSSLALIIVAKNFFYPTAYSHLASLSVDNTQAALTTSPATFLVLLISSLLLTFTILMRKAQVRELALVVGTLGLTMLPFLIWDTGQMYYHLPSQVMAVIAMVYVVNYLTDSFAVVSKKKLSLLVFASWIGFALYVYKQDMAIFRHWHTNYIAGGALVKFILLNNWDQITVYTSIPEYESNHKVFLYLTTWNGTCLKVVPDMDQWLAPAATPEDLVTLSSKATEAFVEDPSPQKVLIVDKANSPEKETIFGTKIEICGTSPFVGKVCNFVVYTDASLFPQKAE